MRTAKIYRAGAGPRPVMACMAALLLLGGCVLGSTPDDSAKDAADDVSVFDFGTEEPPPALIVKLTHDKKDGGAAPLVVTYTVDIGTLDPRDFIFDWDFGDGDTREEQWEEGEDAATLLTMKHDYKYKGEYCTKIVVIWRKNLSTRADALACVKVIQPAELVLSTVKLESAEVVGIGDGVTLSFDIDNFGDTVVEPFETAIFMSKDATLDKDDLKVHAFTIKGMGSGLTGVAHLGYRDEDAVSFDVPNGVPNGPYWLFVHVDHTLIVNEFNDLDNIGPATTLLEVNNLISAKPDLTVTKPHLTSSSASYSPGDAVTYTMDIKNIGEGEGKNFNFAVFLSKDEKLNHAPGVPNEQIDLNKQDLPVTDSATTKVKVLAPGASLPLTRGMSVPDVPDGNYCLIAKIDVNDAVFETNETNNIAICTSKLVVKKVFTQSWDLALQAMTVAPKGTYLGGTVAVQYTVKNIGNIASPANVPVTVYFCPTETLSEKNCIMNKTTLTLPALVAGQEHTDQQNISVDKNTPVQTYSVHMRIDPPPFKFPDESKGNNTKKFSGLVVTATAKVDLLPHNIGFHPDSVSAGSVIKVSYKIENKGTSGSGVTKTAVAVSQNASFSRSAVNSGVNIVIAKINEAPVEGMSTVYRSATVVVPIGLEHSLTEHYLGVVLDVDDEEGAESAADALNNGAPAPNKIKVSGAKGGCYEDKFDLEGKKNDEKGQATLIQPGTTDSLALCGAEDWYAVKMNKGHSLFVTLKASELLWTSPIAADLDVDLVAPDGKVLDSIKNLGLAKKASALTVPSSDNYLIRVYPHTLGVQAHYSLEVKVEGPPSGVDLFASHLTVGPTATFPGGLIKTSLALTNLGDNAAAPFVVRYMLSTDPTISDADTKLLDVPFAQGLGAAQSLLFKRNLVLPVVAGGKYYVGAMIDAAGVVAETDEKNNIVTSNSVQLNSKITCATDSFSGNHTVEEAAAISPTDKKYENLNVCPGLEDWFAITLPQGKALSAKVNWKQVSGNGIIGLQIVDPSQSGVVAGSANPQNTLAKLPYLQSGGTYYIHTYVLPEGGKTAQPYDYELEIAVAEPDPTDVCLSDVYEPNGSDKGAKELGCGFANLTLCMGYEDWFYLDLAKDEKVTLDFQHKGNSFNFELFSNPSYKALQKLSASGKINYTAAAAGKYYVRVSYKENKKPAVGFAYTLKVDGGKGVDLLPEIKSLFPTKAAQNDDVFVSSKFSNECKTDAGAFEYCYWFSADNKLDDKDQLMLKGSVTGGLTGKTEATVDDKAAVPTDAKPGPAYVIVEVDCAHEVTESQELNNIAAGGLEVVKLCLPDLLEPNPSPNYAKSILPGKTADLSLCPYDLDWYAIEAEAGETITISLEFDIQAGDGDLDLRLYEVGKFSSPVASAKTKNVPEQLVYTAEKSTKYYIRVNGFAGQSNSYDLFYCKKKGGSCYECLDSKECNFAAGDFCNPQGKCQALGCTIGDDKTCDDGNSCTIAKCSAGVGCAVTILNEAACSDGDACTLGEICTDKGVCTAAKELQITAAKAELHGHGSVMVPLADGKRLRAGDIMGDDGQWKAHVELQDINQTIWGLSYEVTGTLAHHLADAVTRTDAAEVIAVGTADLALPSTPTAALLMRLSGVDGVAIDVTLLGGAGKHRALTAVQQMATNSFIAAGQATAEAPSDERDGWMVRFQADGSVVWELRTGGAGVDSLHDVAVAGDGTLLAVGVDRDDKAAAGGWVVGVSDAGKVLWSKNLAAGGTQSSLWAIAVGGGDLVAIGGGSDLGQSGAKPEPTYQSWVAWLSGQGFAKEPALAGSAILPATTPQDADYKGTKVSLVHDLAWTPDGGLVAAGTTGADKDAKGGFDGAIWIVDNNKKLGKTHPFGDVGHDGLRSIATGGGQIIAFGTADVGAVAGPRWYEVSVTPPKADCNDGNPCSVDVCKADLGCVHEPVKDGDACGIGLSCKAGVCH